ncbi:hypothetical protein ACMDCR_25770 [Labrys okinawensis]|uniref:hypothetical protein n=1 Tax=Labrys okinawensis TaxID=346911 RepID=UPI0039BCCF03
MPNTHVPAAATGLPETSRPRPLGPAPRNGSELDQLTWLLAAFRILSPEEKSEILALSRRLLREQEKDKTNG